MKDSKISLLVLLSLALLLLALMVLFVWGFSFYKQSIKQATPTTIIVKDSSSITSDIRDSLQKVYTAAINELYTQLDSTQINTEAVAADIDQRMKEFYFLRDEINLLLQKNPSTINLLAAQTKITALQQRIDEWRNRYADVSSENKRLSELLKKMSDAKAVNGNTTQSIVPSVTIDKVETAPPIIASTSITIAGIEFSAIMQLDDKEKETVEALQTDLLKISINVKSNQTTNEELYVVLTQPDGKLMKLSDWETGVFQTNQGRKIYSYRFRFDAVAGQTKKVGFSMSAPTYLKGNYSMQVYHKGEMVARINKKLS